MRGENVFTEQQRFKQIWLWALFIPINGLIIYGFVSQVFLGKTFGDKPSGDLELAIAVIVTSLATLFFALLRLDTEINKEGVYYRYLPFQQKYKKISWDSISKSFVRKYRPLMEYGGWGIRGAAYNVSGNMGLQLVYNSGKKFLLGTQRPEELEKVLKQLGHFTPDDSSGYRRKQKFATR